MDSIRAYFNNPNIEEIKNLKESQFFERKPSTIQGKDLADVISAFANWNVEGGLIGIGINDDGSIEGINFVGQEKLNNLLKIPEIFIPDAQTEIIQVSCKNSHNEDDKIILIYVHYSPNKVIKTVGGKALKRVGDSTMEMSPEEIRELEVDKKQTDFELEIVSDATISDLDNGLLDEYINSWINQDGLIQKPSINDALKIKGLVIEKEGMIRLTNAGVLLFAKTPQKWFSGAKIRFLKYEGTESKTGEELNITKDRTIEGPIVKQVNEIKTIIGEHIREFSRLDENGKFTTTPEYPEFCWLEAIVNAVVHRSYSLKNANIFIKLFDDRLEVESPGNFPGVVTPENIYFQHFPRNPRLMEGFRIFKIVKAASEGVDRMRQLMRTYNLEDPKFINDKQNYKVVVYLHNNIQKRRLLNKAVILKERIKESILQVLSNQETEIVLYMLQNEFKINSAETQSLLNVSRQRAHQIFQELINKQIILQKGETGPNVYYELKSDILVSSKSSPQTETSSGSQSQQGSLGF